VDRLDQLFARSVREIEAHSPVLGRTEAGQQLLREAASLLAGLRLWAQEQYRSDRVVKDLLERCDICELEAVAGELRSGRTPGVDLASQSIVSIVSRPPGEVTVVASCALAAL
jgi:hypothetical protein